MQRHWRGGCAKAGAACTQPAHAHLIPIMLRTSWSSCGGGSRHSSGCAAPPDPLPPLPPSLPTAPTLPAAPATPSASRSHTSGTQSLRARAMAMRLVLDSAAAGQGESDQPASCTQLHSTRTCACPHAHNVIHTHKHTHTAHAPVHECTAVALMQPRHRRQQPRQPVRAHAVLPHLGHCLTQRGAHEVGCGTLQLLARGGLRRGWRARACVCARSWAQGRTQPATGPCSTCTGPEAAAAYSTRGSDGVP